MGYDPEKREKATPADVHAIFKKYLGGLVLFPGEVIARSTFNTVLKNDNLYVTTAEIGEKCSDRIEKKRSLYISPLEKRIKEEYVSMYDIQANDIIYIDGVRNNTFCLVIEDARKRNVATFEFWVKGDMLYVPKRVRE